MEREGQPAEPEDPLAEASDTGEPLSHADTPPERRAGWIDRRQKSEER